jgi:hypothetical protein
VKKLVATLTLALLAALALAVSPANATHSNGQGPQMDLAAGTGQLDAAGLALKAHVNAMSGPSGENPQGDFYLEAAISSFPTPFHVRGGVTCLNVVGNRATVGGVIERSDHPAFPEGSGIFLFIRDDDEGVGDGIAAGQNAAPPQTCQFLEPGLPNTQGNFIVHDATP